MPTLIGCIAGAIVVAAFFYALVRDIRRAEPQLLEPQPQDMPRNEGGAARHGSTTSYSSRVTAQPPRQRGGRACLVWKACGHHHPD